MVESKLAVTLMLSVFLASWILDCEGFVGPFPTGGGKRLLQKTGNLSVNLRVAEIYTQTGICLILHEVENTGVNSATHK